MSNLRNKIITTLGFLYVAYAILTAYSALGRFEETHTPNTFAGQVQPRDLKQVSGNHQPMDLVDEETFVSVRGQYRVIIWHTDSCIWCERFEKYELPKLEKEGTAIEIKGPTDKPEKGQKKVKIYPTIRVYRGKILIKEFEGYTDADKILNAMRYRVVLLR